MQALCQSVSDLASERSPSLKASADFINSCFLKIFRSFRKCQSVYDSSDHLSEEKIIQLGKDI